MQSLETAAEPSLSAITTVWELLSFSWHLISSLRYKLSQKETEDNKGSNKTELFVKQGP